jgi:hypothetical protein
VVANQYQNSLITSFTSIVCALLVAAILFIALRRSGPTRSTGRPSSPRVA